MATIETPETPKKRAYTRKAPSIKTEKMSDMVTVCFRSHHDKIFEIDNRPIVIRGHNSRLRGVNGDVLDSGRAFGETIISRKDWDAIKAKYGSDPNEKLFKGGFIFAAADKADARAEAKEKENLKTGLEPVDTKKTATREDKER